MELVLSVLGHMASRRKHQESIDFSGWIFVEGRDLQGLDYFTFNLNCVAWLGLP
jgi:hypothetical protein